MVSGIDNSCSISVAVGAIVVASKTVVVVRAS